MTAFDNVPYAYAFLADAKPSDAAAHRLKMWIAKRRQAMAHNLMARAAMEELVAWRPLPERRV
jgi:hypothetical protein